MGYVSIIIPTYNDWLRLAVCLKALEEQEIGKDKFEIIVVNNNPLNPIPGNYEIPLNCIVVNESKPGSYAARNKGLQLAKGDIIGFTDSDCTPSRGWIKAALNFFDANENIHRIAGNVKLYYKSDKLSAAETFEKAYSFRQDLSAKSGTSVTANMFTRRVVFSNVGLFNEKLMSGGDTEWGLRAQAQNFAIAYLEEASVSHPARYYLQELAKKARRIGGKLGDKKLLVLARSLKYMIPPVNSLVHGKGLSLKERGTVFMVRYYLNIIRTIEELAVAFGKTPARE